MIEIKNDNSPESFADVEQRELVEPLLTQLSPGSTIIDGGCGMLPYMTAGDVSWPSSRTLADVRYIAVDANERLVEGPTMNRRLDSIRQKGVDAEFIGANLEYLPFSDSSIDEVFLSEVILPSLGYHSDPVAIVEEAHRVLKDNGRLIIRESDLAKYLYKSGEDNPRYELSDAPVLKEALKRLGFTYTVVEPESQPKLVRELLKVFPPKTTRTDLRDAFVVARKGGKQSSENPEHVANKTEPGQARLVGRVAFRKRRAASI